jgi:two-component system phosphate regulon sensor histidine kinase PhoR
VSRRSEGRPVRSSLRSVFAILLTTIVLGGGAALIAVRVVDDQLNSVVDRYSPLVAANAAVLQALTDAETGERGYQLTTDTKFLQPYYSGLDQYPLSIHQALALAPNAAGRRLVTSEERAAQRWISTYAKPIVAVHGAEPRAQLEATLARGKVLFDRLRRANSAVGSYARAAISLARRRAGQAVQDSYLILAVITLLAAALAAGGSRLLSRALVVPLERMAATIERLAGGDWTARAIQTGPTELRIAARAVNELVAERERQAVEQNRRTALGELTVKVGRHVREQLELTPILEDAVATIGRAIGCDRVTIRLCQDGAVGPVSADWSSPDVAPLLDGAAAAPPRWQDFMGGVAAGHASFAAEDVETAPDLAALPEVLSYFRHEGVRGLVVCPLRVGEESLGTLAVVHLSRVRRWEPVDLAMIEEVATDLSRAILHSQLYERQLRLVSELRELDQAKTDFLSTVSHEMRTPLTSITGYVELLLDGEAGAVSEEQKRMLAIVERNTERLKGLIEDLLTLSRIESGAFKVEPVRVDMAEVIRAAAASVAPAAARKKLRLDTDAPAEQVTVQVDAGQVERAVLNLLNNAVKFTPEGGSVSVALHRRGAQAEIIVADTGIGIPPEDRPEIFSRFYRASNAVDQAIPGTGLGLAIVRTIVEQHQGRLEMDSVLGQGTRFTIRLPVCEVEPVTPA